MNFLIVLYTFIYVLLYIYKNYFIRRMIVVIHLLVFGTKSHCLDNIYVGHFVINRCELDGYYNCFYLHCHCARCCGECDWKVLPYDCHSYQYCCFGLDIDSDDDHKWTLPLAKCNPSFLHRTIWLILYHNTYRHAVVQTLSYGSISMQLLLLL